MRPEKPPVGQPRGTGQGDFILARNHSNMARLPGVLVAPRLHCHSKGRTVLLTASSKLQPSRAPVVVAPEGGGGGVVEVPLWNDALFPLVVICFLSNLARRGERRAKARATAADWKKYICLNPLSCSCYSADRKTRPTADVERVPPDFLAAGEPKKATACWHFHGIGDTLDTSTAFP